MKSDKLADAFRSLNMAIAEAGPAMAAAIAASEFIEAGAALVDAHVINGLEFLSLLASDARRLTRFERRWPTDMLVMELRYLRDIKAHRRVLRSRRYWPSDRVIRRRIRVVLRELRRRARKAARVTTTCDSR